MTFLRILMAVATLAVFAPLPASAQGPEPGMAMPEIKHVPLTSEMVGNFVASMPAMKEFSRQNKLDRPPQERGKDPFTAFVGYLEAKGLKAKADAVVGKFGFSNVRKWMMVSQSVMIAHGFSKSGKTPEQMKQEMKTMIDQVSNDPRIPADQRGVLLQRFKHQMDMTLKMIPPAANIKAVRPYAKVLDESMARETRSAQ